MSGLLTSLPSAARWPADFATFCGPLCRIRAARVHLLVSGLLASFGRLFATPCANKCGAWPYLLRLPKLNSKYGTGGKKIHKNCHWNARIYIIRAISAAWVYFCRSSMCEMRARSLINYCGSVFIYYYFGRIGDRRPPLLQPAVVRGLLCRSRAARFSLFPKQRVLPSVCLLVSALLTPLSFAARCAGFALRAFMLRLPPGVCLLVSGLPISLSFAARCAGFKLRARGAWGALTIRHFIYFYSRTLSELPGLFSQLLGLVPSLRIRPELGRRDRPHTSCRTSQKSRCPSQKGCRTSQKD